MIFVFQLVAFFSHLTQKGSLWLFGGMVKSQHEVLYRRPQNDQLMTPRQIFNRKHTSCSLGYCSKDDYEREWQRE